MRYATVTLVLLLLLVVGLALGIYLLRPAAPSAPAVALEGVRGEVHGPNGPVADALVRVKGTATCTRTDARGQFHLPGAKPSQRLTAWAPGFLIAGERAGSEAASLRLTPLPEEDDPGYEWVDPSPDPDRELACANCHAEIHREWAAGGHARSATGRRFRNLYEGTNWAGKPGIGWGLLTEHPTGSGVCAACHAPATDDGIVDMTEVGGVARHGVHCDYCHKVSDVGDNKGGLTFGRFNLTLLRPRKGQLFFGPLDDVDRGEDVYSPLYRDSRYCASCHEGVVFGVHVYSTYSEWLASPARQKGQHCQHCHMTPTGTMTNIAPGHGGIDRDPATLASHRLFQPSQEAMLRRCLRLATDLQPKDGGHRVDIRVGVEGVGHRVPTGFVDRHLLLVVEGLSTDGKTLLPKGGPRLPPEAGPELTGLAGKVYAKSLRDERGRNPVPFWLAEPEHSDNRLTPGQEDRVTVDFPGPLARVRVRVLYRRFWSEVVRAKGWPDQDVLVREVVVEARAKGKPSP